MRQNVRLGATDRVDLGVIESNLGVILQNRRDQRFRCIRLVAYPPQSSLPLESEPLPLILIVAEGHIVAIGIGAAE